MRVLQFQKYKRKEDSGRRGSLQEAGQREGITDGRKPGKSSSRKWEPDCRRGFRKNKLGKNDTNAHTHGERVDERPAEWRWQIHTEKRRAAHKHTPGWPFLMAVLVCNCYLAFSLNLSSDRMRGCMHAHTHMEPQQLWSEIDSKCTNSQRRSEK